MDPAQFFLEFFHPLRALPGFLIVSSNITRHEPVQLVRHASHFCPISSSTNARQAAQGPEYLPTIDVAIAPVAIPRDTATNIRHSQLAPLVARSRTSAAPRHGLEPPLGTFVAHTYQYFTEPRHVLCSAALHHQHKTSDVIVAHLCHSRTHNQGWFEPLSFPCSAAT